MEGFPICCSSRNFCGFDGAKLLGEMPRDKEHVTNHVLFGVVPEPNLEVTNLISDVFLIEVNVTEYRKHIDVPCVIF